MYPTENSTHTNHRECLLISELTIGSAPLASHFFQRNRIIAGCSQVLAVTEATNYLGSLIAAAFARKYGRPILATPRHPNALRYSGTNHLLKNGAIMLESAFSILRAPDAKTAPHGNLKTTFWR